MSAPGTRYGGRDDWRLILDQFRCESVEEGFRCQLYRDHDGGHAHAEGMPTQHLAIRRWTDGGERWTEDAKYGMRWCCMFST